MKTKIKYSKCLTELYSLYNNLDKNDIKFLQKESGLDFEICRQTIFSQKLAEIERCSLCDDVDVKTVIGAINGIFSADLLGKSLHIFVETENLLTFLENLNVKDLEGIKKYISDNSETVFIADTEKKIAKEKKQFVICLHLPNTDKGYTFSVFVEDDDTLTLDYIEGINYAQINSSNDFLKNPKSDVDEMDLKVWQLMLNTIMYMECFPDCVRNGLPKGFISNSYKSKKFILSANDVVKENVKLSSSGYTVTPHFRKAHFRYCGSSYYKKAKGKFVFIHGTMVNSKNVKTLIEEFESENL